MKDLTRPDLGDGLEARHSIREAIELEMYCSDTVDAVGLQEAVEMVSWRKGYTVRRVGPFAIDFLRKARVNSRIGMHPGK